MSSINNSSFMRSSISSSSMKRTCMSHGGEETDKDIGISCGQNHYLCNECFHAYLNVCLFSDEAQNKVPIKCADPTCRQELLAERVISLMNPVEYDQYIILLLANHNFFSENEEFYRCPFCKYGIIYTKNQIPLFFFCLDTEKCGKMSCKICFKECKYDSENDDDDDDNGDEQIHEMNENPGNSTNPKWHFKCDLFKDIKKEFDDLLQKGSTNSCPYCSYEGQKDDACCHMKCGKCDSQWCYCCERKYEEQDRDQDENSHEIDWENNIKRCPMYLNDFVNVDDDWPDFGNEKDASCVDIYHREKTLYLLQSKIKNEYSTEEKTKVLKKAMIQFPGLLNSFSLTDISNFKLKDCLKGRIKGTY